MAGNMLIRHRFARRILQSQSIYKTSIHRSNRLDGGFFGSIIDGLRTSADGARGQTVKPSVQLQHQCTPDTLSNYARLVDLSVAASYLVAHSKQVEGRPRDTEIDEHPAGWGPPSAILAAGTIHDTINEARCGCIRLEAGKVET
jgi:hypothetical protein